MDRASGTSAVAQCRDDGNDDDYSDDDAETRAKLRYDVMYYVNKKNFCRVIIVFRNIYVLFLLFYT